MLSGPILRDTARLSQRYPPIARYGVFDISTWPIGCDTPSPLFWAFPHWRACEVEVRYPPQKGYLSDTPARYPKKTRQKGALPPSAILSRKGIARYGGVSCTGPLRERAKMKSSWISPIFVNSGVFPWENKRDSNRTLVPVCPGKSSWTGLSLVWFAGVTPEIWNFLNNSRGLAGHYPVKQGLCGKSHQKVHPNVRQNLCHTVSLWGAPKGATTYPKNLLRLFFASKIIFICWGYF